MGVASQVQVLSGFGSVDLFLFVLGCFSLAVDWIILDGCLCLGSLLLLYMPFMACGEPCGAAEKFLLGLYPFGDMSFSRRGENSS